MLLACPDDFLEVSERDLQREPPGDGFEEDGQNLVNPLLYLRPTAQPISNRPARRK
jgi:hypothetical protein